jgi:hypothetical protein
VNSHQQKTNRYGWRQQQSKKIGAHCNPIGLSFRPK